MKVGIVGSGMIVKDFLSITPYLRDFKLTAICGTKRSGQVMNELKSFYGIDKIFFDYDEFLNSGLDIVYIALPNNLHFQFTKKALEADKNVIIEKPIASTYKETAILSSLAKKRRLFIFEAINNQYLPNYKKIKELLPAIGNIKIVQCNYSQYSGRYNNFKKGIIQPAFNPEFSGGALMDLNIYNIHYAIGIFGKPVKFEYFPNIEKGIDTSGMLLMDYGAFKCICIGAKDCMAPGSVIIQGDNGYIHQNTPANICKGFELLLNDGTRTLINENKYDHRMINEFIEFIDMIRNDDIVKCYRMLEQSLMVSQIQTIARNKSGIIFPADIIGSEEQD